MSQEFYCPKCLKRIYIKPRANNGGWFFTDKKATSTLHSDSCLSGEFKDSDILGTSKKHVRTPKDPRQCEMYRGINYNELTYVFDEELKYANIFNKYYSQLLGGKKLFLIKYNNINYLLQDPIYKDLIPLNYIELDYIPIVVGTEERDELIWVKNNRPVSLKYNYLYLFERKVNIIPELKCNYVYENITDELTEDSMCYLIYEILANEMNCGVVDAILNKDTERFGDKETGIEELEEILMFKKKIGEEGELLVLNKERETLSKLGLEIYAKKVVHISRTDVSAGYDIISYSKEKSKMFIEVKTSLNSAKYFYMSNNEWEKAKKLGKAYYIYIVELQPTKRIVRKIQNPTEQDNKMFIREANSYKIKFK